MEKNEIVAAFAAIAQETRLDALRLLLDSLPDGLPAGEVAKVLNIPQNTMSSHLAVLKRAGLVLTQRSGTTIYYRADSERVWRLVDYLVTDFAWETRPAASAPRLPRPNHWSSDMSDHVFNVLFLCTGNSARSILGEAILNKEGAGRFRAFSAGSHPKGVVHPQTIEVLRDMGYDTEGWRSKSWDEFAGPEAPRMDFVFTVCDSAASESCPVWPGQPMTAHWGIEDPAAVVGPSFQKEAAFREAGRFMKNRILAFINLPIASLDRMALQTKLRSIGQLEGGSSTAKA
jgi:arsenate reductase